MKTLFASILFLLLMTLITKAQTTNLAWAKKNGGTSNDAGNSIAVDASGNVYTTGTFTGTVDFDPGGGTYNLSASDGSMFISKLNRLGDFLWAKQLGGGSAVGSSIAVDANGNVYTTGYFSGTADFDPSDRAYNLTSAGADDIFVSKLDASGNFVWAKHMGGAADERGNSIAVDATGNVYTTGYFSSYFNGPVDFDPGPGTYNFISKGALDIFVSKLDVSGNFLWAKQMGGTDADIGYSIAIDGNGNVYTTGTFTGTADFDPGPGTYNLTLDGLTDMFISKLDASGNFVWAKQMGGGGYNIGSSIAIDATGNVYTTGYFNGTTDFDPGAATYNLTAEGPISTDNYDLFVSRLDASGNFVWAKQMGGAKNEQSYSIALDASGNVYTTGLFSGTSDFNPGAGTYYLTSAGLYDIFMSELDASGNFVSAKKMGGEDYDYGQSIAVDPNGNIYITGLFYGTADFDPNVGIYNLTSLGSDDIFIVKLKQEQSIFIEPKILITKAVLNVGETEQITGSDFSANGTIKLTIKNESDELVGANIPIIYTNPGKFSYSLSVTNAFKNGEYQVYATDNSSGKTTPVIKFRVNKPGQTKLWINNPLAKATYSINELFHIQWGDYVDKSLAIGKSGFVQKHYKIERSDNLGSSWSVIDNDYTINNATPGTNNNDFSRYCSISASGVYIIRITDKENPADFDVSEPFEVKTILQHNFSTSLVWDKSCKETDFMPSPIGLAADGTSRIFIKLSKDPSVKKAVSSIEATIYPAGDDNSTAIPSLLGKVLYAPAVEYNFDADKNATKITATKSFDIPSSASDFYFWLLAPDDFTRNPADQRGERKIEVDFDITYADNSHEAVNTSGIYIVRPPLFLVHGLRGDAKSFVNAKYNVNGTMKYFNTVDKDGILINNPTWKEARRLSLDNYASFSHNAEIILGIHLSSFDVKYPNTFKSILTKMHLKRYACNRIDYVAHSMGGCIARSLIIQYPEIYKPKSGDYKNYDKGYINKLITINTPHNGSYLADLVYDRYDKNFLTGAYAFFYSNGYLNNAFFRDGKPSDAIKNLQAYHGGIRFPKTIVKNHLIGSDLDKYDYLTEKSIRESNNLIASAYGALIPYQYDNIHSCMLDLYGTSEYLSNSDMVVPISSELPGRVGQAIDLDLLPDVASTASIKYGIDNSHTQITDDLVVGTRVMHLLNAPINSNFFADDIEANEKNMRTNQNRLNSITLPSDTTINYFDTASIKILNTFADNSVFVDSVIQANINVKDTAHLQRIRLAFQTKFYDSYSKASNQTFNFSTHSDAIGKNILAAEATYDSLGYTINHVDTITLYAKSLDTLTGFYLSSRSETLNPKQLYQPTYNAVYTHYIGTLNKDIDSLSFIIADTNVVRFDSLNYRFIAKDTGTTNIIFKYENFSDTVFIYISVPNDENIKALCASANASFSAGTTDPSKTYRWQVDTGNGFIDLANSSIYTGTNTSTLTLNSPATNFYGYRYRCLISDSIGSVISTPQTLKFVTTWTGSVTTAWENPSNWSCGVLPDENTDVIINSGISNNPVVNTNSSCRSIIVSPSVQLTVTNGHSLSIKGK